MDWTPSHSTSLRGWRDLTLRLSYIQAEPMVVTQEDPPQSEYQSEHQITDPQAPLAARGHQRETGLSVDVDAVLSTQPGVGFCCAVQGGQKEIGRKASINQNKVDNSSDLLFPTKSTAHPHLQARAGSIPPAGR